MTEIVFLVEDAPEGGLVARALGHAIHTDADSYAACASRCVTQYSATSMPANARR